MKRALITGGTGFFGKSILDYFSRHACCYEFLTLSRHGGDIVGDVATFDFPREKIDVILHLASPLLGSMSDAALHSAVMSGARHVADLAKRDNAPILFASSGAVYGKTNGAVLEGGACEPMSAYGSAKLAAERYLIDRGLDVKIARCFAFVGRHLPRNGHFAIGNFIQNCLDGQPIVIKGDGSPMRSYLFADDLVEWLFAILERGESGRAYNVGSDQAISIKDLALLVRDTLQSNNQTIKQSNNQTILPVHVLGQSVAGAANYYVPNVERARRELGLVVKVGLKEAIARSV